MQSFTKTIFLFLCSLALYSCAVLSSKSASIDVDKVSQEGFVMAKPIVADIKVEIRKIQGTATVKTIDYKENKAAAIRAAKSLAVMDAVKKGDADVIVQPMYTVEQDMKNTTATVTGFAGKYKAFRQYAKSDSLAFSLRVKMNGTSLITTIDQPTEVNVTKGKKK